MSERSFWDERYGQKEYVYGKEPNAYFREEISKMVPGTLYLPGEGEGRNAAFAAGLGWQVTAVDQSVEGYAKAMRLAKEKGAGFAYLIQDLREFEPPASSFDLAAVLFVHFHPGDRESFHRKIVESLNPGGRVLLEVFHKKQTYFQEQYESGGPKDVEMLYDKEILRSDFAGLEINHLEEQFISLDEGNRHSGKAAVIRMVGTKH